MLHDINLQSNLCIEYVIDRCHTL